jgi:hypothetical protein
LNSQKNTTSIVKIIAAAGFLSMKVDHKRVKWQIILDLQKTICKKALILFLVNKILFLLFGYSFVFNLSATTPKNPAPKAPPKSCTPSGVAPPTVGPGYSDPKLCCPGNIIIVQTAACEKAYGGFAGICAPCGNKKCDTEWENDCNCPEDCSLLAPPPPKK